MKIHIVEMGYSNSSIHNPFIEINCQFCIFNNNKIIKYSKILYKLKHNSLYISADIKTV